MRNLKVTVVVAVLAMMFAPGCKKGEPTVVGTWKNQTLPEVVQFRKDHTGTFVVKGEPGLSFSWSEPGQNAVQLDVGYQGKVQTLTGRVEKNTLILEGKGAQAVYSRTE